MVEFVRMRVACWRWWQTLSTCRRRCRHAAHATCHPRRLLDRTHCPPAVRTAIVSRPVMYRLQTNRNRFTHVFGRKRNRKPIFSVIDASTSTFIIGFCYLVFGKCAGINFVPWSEFSAAFQSDRGTPVEMTELQIMWMRLQGTMEQDGRSWPTETSRMSVCPWRPTFHWERQGA